MGHCFALPVAEGEILCSFTLISAARFAPIFALAAWRWHDKGHSVDRDPVIYGAFVAYKIIPAYVAEYQLSDKMQETSSIRNRESLF